MKRLILSAVLALSIHASILMVNLCMFGGKIVQETNLRTVTMTMTYHQQQRRKPVPVVPKKEHTPAKKQTKKKKPKRVVKPKPSQKPETLPEPIETSQEPLESIHEPEEEVITQEASLTEEKSAKTLREAMPLYRVNPAPKYPKKARRRGLQGTVLLNVLVGKNGEVIDLNIFESSGYAILDRSAAGSVRGWFFEPGMRGDKAIEMWVRVPVRFQLN